MITLFTERVLIVLIERTDALYLVSIFVIQEIGRQAVEIVGIVKRNSLNMEITFTLRF